MKALSLYLVQARLSNEKRFIFKAMRKLLEKNPFLDLWAQLDSMPLCGTYQRPSDYESHAPSG
jgi:hypothetical protein